MPKVSVIIPNYNHAPYLEQRIESVLNQTFQDFEVILMDDCSKDHSVEILKKYADHPKVSYLLLNEQNSGSTFRQWKKGLEYAKGEYIWIAESDDWAEITFLESLVPIAEKDETLGIAYCRTIPVNENNQIMGDGFQYFDEKFPGRWHHDFYNQGKDEIRNYLSVMCTIPNASAILFRRKALAQVNFDFSFRLYGDWYVYLQILDQYNIAYCSKLLNYQRGHPDNVRSSMKFSTNFQEKIAFYMILVKHLPGYNFSYLRKSIVQQYFKYCKRAVRMRRFSDLPLYGLWQLPLLYFSRS